MAFSRKVTSLNQGWRFFLGDSLPEAVTQHGNFQIINNETNQWQKAGNFGVSKADNPHTDAWRQVDLPHDFALEGEFTQEAGLYTGSLKHGKAYYVRKFPLAAAASAQRIHLEFDGVFRNCSVYMNGHFVGRHLSGYTSFGFDVTELCLFGAENAVAVFVDATDNELWSYEGAGIYRAVRLVQTAPVFVPQWGTYVVTGGADDPGRVTVEATVCNRLYDAAACTVSYTVFSPQGEPVASSEAAVSLSAMGEAVVHAALQVANPQLWSLADPQLYTLETRILIDGESVDVYPTMFGFRYFYFDAQTGFYLNGQPLKLKGVCCHQDHAGVGVAVPPALQAWRVARLKDMGCNAIRTSHNPPDPALLDACDRLGLLVMDEARLPGVADELLGQLEGLIRRDRNHPSVILWSLGNEEMAIQHTPTGINLFRRMQHLAHQLDPSRPTTYGMNMGWSEICDIHDQAGFRFDVFGVNYRSGQRSAHYDDFHARYPDWPLVGTETWGGSATRGLYEPDVMLGDTCRHTQIDWLDERYRGFASAYGTTATPWGYTIEETWQDCATRPFLSGTFLWTGFDYRGEIFPYAWPAVITRFGILDYCGFYKEVAHYLRAWWRPEDPHIFLMPHWDWQGREGQPITVRCYANCHAVELALNGESLGRQVMPENGKLEWTVPYQPGQLVATGYDPAGNVLVIAERRTTTGPARLEVTAHRQTLAADGEDVAVVDVAIVDGSGAICPRANHLVVFEVSGPARILGVANGDPLSHEPDKFTNQRRAYHGLCQVLVQSTGEAGEVKVTASSWGLTPGVIQISANAG